MQGMNCTVLDVKVFEKIDMGISVTTIVCVLASGSPKESWPVQHSVLGLALFGQIVA